MAEGHTNPIVNLCNLIITVRAGLVISFSCLIIFHFFFFFFLKVHNLGFEHSVWLLTFPQKENRPLWLGREEGGGELRKPYRDMRDRSVSAYFRYHHGRRIEIVNELAVLQAKRSNETNGDICPSRKPPSFS